MSQTGKAARRYRKQQNKAAARAAYQEEQRRRKRRRGGVRLLVGVLIAAVLIGVFASLTSNSKKKTGATTTTTVAVKAGKLPKGCTSKKPAPVKNRPTFSAAPDMTIDPAKSYTATFETTCGTMVAALDAKNAPITTNSFVFLARKGFFDGLKFHRVVSNFVIQGGDPKGTGSGGPGYTLPEEPPKAGGAYHTGDLAMAKTSAAHSTGSQFFVVTGDPSGLNAIHTYSLFGSLTKGLDVAKKIESLHPQKAGYDGAPNPDAYIFKVTITESAA